MFRSTRDTAEYLRDGFKYSGIARRASLIAVELDALERGESFADGEVQKFVQYLDEEIFDGKSFGEYSEFNRFLLKEFGILEPGEDQHYDAYYRAVSQKLKDYFLEPLRNVGSRGPANIAKMRKALLKMTDVALAMTPRRGGCFG